MNTVITKNGARRKVLAILLTAVMLFGLLTTVAPITASAAVASTLVTTINNFTHGGTGTLSATANANSVTVTGTVTGAANTLTLNIDSGVTVIWEASYSGEAGIGIEGAGTFEVAEGGRIIAADSISTTGSIIAIHSVSGTGEIIISGGEVSASHPVSAVAVKVDYSSVTVTVTGGTVRAAGAGYNQAIYCGSGGVNISGGRIIAENGTTNRAVYSDGQPTVTVSGAVLVSPGTSVADLFDYYASQNHYPIPLDTTNGVVVVWDGVEPADYEASIGTASGLITEPSTATATWAKQGNKYGISYVNGSLRGFIPIADAPYSAPPYFPAETTTYYTVAFETNGGGTIASQSIAGGGKAAKPADPEKDGYAFAGWFKDAELTQPYDFGAAVTQNLTLRAKWTWNNPFDDVHESDWFCGDVEYVYTHELMIGITANLFSPQSPLTRGQIVTILYRREGQPGVGALGNPFGDVAAGKYYTDAVKWAAANDLVLGYGDGSYGPEDSVTREQLAAILYRYMKYAGLAPNVTQEYVEFNDEAEISDYAKGAAQALYKIGVINGKPGNLFDPRGTATRAETAAMLHRLFM